MIDGMNRFTYNPTTVNITRSRFDRSSEHKTTFNSGELIPIYLDEVLPGDTVSMDTAAVVRMATPKFPVMDNAFMDLYYFFVPMRLVWDHTKEFFGENTTGPWEQQAEYTIPQVKIQDARVGSMMDYFGLPLIEGDAIAYYFANALPFRSYALIWNEYFRDQNVMTPIPIDKGDSTILITSSFLGTPWYESTMTPERFFLGNRCCPLPVSKFHDYFTSALPEPQKGPAVTLPLAGTAPLVEGDMYDFGNFQFGSSGWNFGNSTEMHPLYLNNNGFSDDTIFRLFVSDEDNTSGGNISQIDQLNAYADLSQASALTINAFRQALALQGLYELDARGGTRYREIIKSHFGVTSLDARMQVPEFLHGKRIPITMQQVLQTSETTSESPQGNTAAFSLTQDVGNSFIYSATEHGYIIGLACIRTSLTYQQRIEKMWSRRRRFDFYWPVFANLGEQPIYNKELYFAYEGDFSGHNDGSEYDPDTGENAGEGVFGFQEAWAEYRYRPSMITGVFRSNASESLDVWHYSQDFTSQPTLSPQFMIQPQEVVERTLAVSDAPQFIADFAFKSTWVRPMPMYSIPALLGRM